MKSKIVHAKNREYETIYVMRPDVTRETAAQIAKRIEDAVHRETGVLTFVDTWGRRQLAYPVKKHVRGVYVYLKYIGGGSTVAELERNLRMIDEVLKYQTIVLQEEVDRASLEVQPDQIAFEPIQPPPDDEEEESLARRLGLEETPRPEPAPAPEAAATASPVAIEEGEAATTSEAPAEDTTAEESES